MNHRLSGLLRLLRLLNEERQVAQVGWPTCYSLLIAAPSGSPGTGTSRHEKRLCGQLQSREAAKVGVFILRCRLGNISFYTGSL